MPSYTHDPWILRYFVKMKKRTWSCSCSFTLCPEGHQATVWYGHLFKLPFPSDTSLSSVSLSLLPSFLPFLFSFFPFFLSFFLSFFHTFTVNSFLVFSHHVDSEGAHHQVTYLVRTLGSNEISETTMATMKASKFAVFTKFIPCLHPYHDFFKKYF